MIRDQEIVQTANEMLKKYDKVLMIFGGSHLITQEPAFNQAMGKPRYVKLY